jgi:membrane dipeptidase
MKRYDELSEDEEEHALSIHNKSIVVDCCAVIRMDDDYFDRLKEGGITCQNHTFTPVNSNLSEAVKDLGTAHRWIKSHDKQGLIAYNVEDILKAKKEGKSALIFGSQNTSFLERDLGLVHVFKAMGMNICQLTHQYLNDVGAGCGELIDFGLSRFGQELIEEMNTARILIDLSHCGSQTTKEAIECSRLPIIFSHSNPRAVTKHIRNKPDEQIQTLAEKDGVIGLTAYSPHCNKKTGIRPDLNDYLEHIDYLFDLVGVSHIGIGSNIDETSTPDKWNTYSSKHPEQTNGYNYEGKQVKDFDWITKTSNITKGLVGRGYSDHEIEKILGANFLRVFKKTW